MPTELVTQLPALAALIEKLGVIGLLLIVVGWLVYERLRLVKKLAETYQNRDRWRLAYTIVKTAADAKGVTYDLRDVEDLVKEDAKPA